MRIRFLNADPFLYVVKFLNVLLCLEHKITMASGVLVKVVGLADAYRKEVEANRELKDELKELKEENETYRKEVEANRELNDELKEENEKLKRRIEVLELRSRSVFEREGPGNIKKRLKLEDSEDFTQQYEYSQQISESNVNGTASTHQPDDPDPDQSQSLFTVYKQH